MSNINDLHFVSTKKMEEFKLKAHVGPYTVNIREEENEWDEILKQMKFKQRFTWSYDP